MKRRMWLSIGRLIMSKTKKKRRQRRLRQKKRITHMIYLFYNYNDKANPLIVLIWNILTIERKREIYEIEIYHIISIDKEIEKKSIVAINN